MAGNKYYVGQSLDLEIDITVDGAKLTTGADAIISVQKPNRSVVEWVPIIDNVNGKLLYTATPEEIDLPGKWLLQPVVTLAGIPSKIIPGNTITLTVSKRFT